jgi:ubiquinone/menaquinone biosynthesis C-methylase UbiE
MAKLLVLGCGKKERPGNPGDTIVTVDINENVGADVVHNLDVFPWPFEAGEFDVVHLDNVLEHLNNIVKTMEEIHRITKPGATVTIIVPYFRSKWACVDPTHVHFFTVDTLSYFVQGHKYHERYAYSPCKFKMHRKTFNEGIDQTWFQKLLIPFAESNLEFYENKISPIFPLETLTYHMETIK